jgi:aminoglycoside 2''-phosphotransferase
LDRRVQNRLAHQAGQFLNELHHIPLEAAPSELAPQDGMHAWQETYAQVRQELFPRMRPDARQEVSEHFEAFFGQAALQRFEPCLRHGDFGPSNILCELGPGSLSGVIDFSSAGLGDPARDVAAASLYGEAFLKAMAESYPETSRLLERARFYRGIFALEEALTGVQDGDESAIRRGLSKYT